jgi:hypothetical protein
MGGIKMHRLEHDVMTGEVKEIPLTDKEIQELQNEAKILNDKIKEKENALTIKTTEKAALLAKLGITEEEAKLLLS